MRERERDRDMARKRENEWKQPCLWFRLCILFLISHRTALLTTADFPNAQEFERQRIADSAAALISRSRRSASGTGNDSSSNEDKKNRVDGGDGNGNGTSALDSATLWGMMTASAAHAPIASSSSRHGGRTRHGSSSSSTHTTMQLPSPLCSVISSSSSSSPLFAPGSTSLESRRLLVWRVAQARSKMDAIISTKIMHVLRCAFNFLQQKSPQIFGVEVSAQFFIS
jgi:hypothetical protein